MHGQASTSSMRVLAIDTAMAACAAAVFDSEAGIVAARSLPMTRGHAEALLPLVAQVMEEARAAFATLDRIAVTVGPGSFTGLRVGVAAARGLALAAGRPAVGVSTLAALAAPHPEGLVLAAIDARNDLAYMQAFDDGVALGPPRLAPLAEADTLLPRVRVTIVGSAAERLARPAAVVRAAAAPDIAWVARLGVTADAGAPVKPLYLGAPSARPQPIGHLLQR